MNKIILAYYINVGSMSSEETQQVMKNFQNEIKDPEMIQYFIPIREGETRIDCVYPKYVVDEQVNEELRSVINRLDGYVKKISLNQESKNDE